MGKQRLCLLGPLGHNVEIRTAAEKFNIDVVCSIDGEDYFGDDHVTTFYVTSDFEGPIYEKLLKQRVNVLGPTALLQLTTLENARRPLYCEAMRGVTVCFTGFREKAQLTQLFQLITAMGGKVRREMELTTTHLIAHRADGDKFKYADTFGIPVVSETWVLDAWEHRNDSNYSATTPSVVSAHKLKFGGVRVSFMGFSTEDLQYMSQVLVDNNGVLVDVHDPQLTHLVVSETVPPEEISSEKISPSCYVVKAMWFWASVQNEICAEVDDYLLFPVEQRTPEGRVCATPGSAASRARKRKRLQQLAARQSNSPANNTSKRRSSFNTLDNSGSYLDWTFTPDRDAAADEKPEEIKSPQPISPRQQKFYELLHTETNYVDILNVIIKSFKMPLEETAAKGNPILDPMHIKVIFAHLPEILETHSAILNELKAAEKNWSNNFSIGEIILKKANELQKAYPPFINFFEKSKETLEECESKFQRFHAFLRIRQSQPECGRQTLKELLIRPVQRLPSIILILTDLLKHTDKKHPDHGHLQAALAAVREVTTHINEDKRRTEAQEQLIELFYEIENCPPDLVSSARCVLNKAECMDLSEGRRGEPVTMFLFTDKIGICKRRVGKAFPTLRGTKPRNLQKLTKTKLYKNIRLIPLQDICRVIDVKDSDDWENTFALELNFGDPQDSLLAFSLCDEKADKRSLLQSLCQQMAQLRVNIQPEVFLSEMAFAELGLDSATRNTTQGSLTKALKFANNAKAKMGRALSLSRTPSRASRIMSRRGAQDVAQSPALTQLAQMRLQSCANLNELGRDSPRRSSLQSPNLVLPLT